MTRCAVCFQRLPELSHAKFIGDSIRSLEHIYNSVTRPKQPRITKLLIHPSPLDIFKHHYLPSFWADC